MKSIQPVTSSAVALFKSLPVTARVVVAIASVLAVMYFWYFLLGIFLLVAFCVGVYQIVRWFVSQ